ncbi:MAG: hypothetical protein PWP08_9 [Methanofollis sp.]|nr:hypothetical protein [Methanofollis sp.]
MWRDPSPLAKAGIFTGTDPRCHAFSAFRAEKISMMLGDRRTMVVHGPEPFDRGDVGRLLDALGPCRILVAGVMGRTAAEESKVACEFCTVPPSTVFAHLSRPAFLLNRAKTPDSGRVFGEIVAGRLKDGLVHVECASETVFCWNGGDQELADELAVVLGYERTIVRATARPPAAGRTIRGCIPGEPVCVNGIVIGQATAEEVVLRNAGEDVEAVSGLMVKPHGLEKLRRNGRIDLASAWCKSGQIRQKAPVRATGLSRIGRIVLLDHCAHRFYDLVTPDACGVLAIGDDTTTVAGHIAGHLGIPVLGVTDGDPDGVVGGTFPEGSLVLEAVAGRDDEIGLMIAGMIPDRETGWSCWVNDVMETMGDQVRPVFDLR